MCTVLQQHLAKQNGFMDQGQPQAGDGGGGGSSECNNIPSDILQSTPRISQYDRYTAAAQPIYSYLQDIPHLKRPVEPYDKRSTTPTKHFHLPDRNRSRSANPTYIQQLMGRRSRSHSRSGMRVMVDQLSSTPRPKSPKMNNEEAIELSHYPDGRAPDENDGRPTPIERDDFPAPPFAYGSSPHHRRRRYYSEPGASSYSSRSATPIETLSSSDDEEDVPDVKMERTETVLKKIAEQKGGMGSLFLAEMALEKEKRKQLKHRLIDPRSAARTPAANREPHYRLRFESPIFASPSRIADHPLPWDDDERDGGHISRRSHTPFMPGVPSATPLGRVVSPINPIRPGYTHQRPNSGGHRPYIPPTASHISGYESDGGGTTILGTTKTGSEASSVPFHHQSGHRIVSSATAYYSSSTPRSATAIDGASTIVARALTSHSDGDYYDSTGIPDMMQAANIYPLHLLFTTNYRLPGDVDRLNLEKHLSDADFDMVFRMTREDFYTTLPYWKRCDLKRKYHLF